ncbi:MAG: hypothetical protein PVH30_07705 [Desulfobacterales bacterium]|jgi:hypothetical protein
MVTGAHNHQQAAAKTVETDALLKTDFISDFPMAEPLLHLVNH